jgi:hypothetical protein
LRQKKPGQQRERAKVEQALVQGATGVAKAKNRMTVEV